jgi:putative SOS response-associated peptidase YedK
VCSNYIPVTRLDRLLSFFGVEPSGDLELPAEVYPLRLAPFIRLAEDGSGNKVIEAGQFGLLPQFATELVYGRKTYNARWETVDTLRSFKDSWVRSRRCIIPAEAVFEPCYETGETERWCIYQPGAVPMGIAGVYRLWRAPNGQDLWTFAMLTCNADEHPFYKRFHGPGEEKRMPVILDPAEYQRWLMCTPAQAKAMCVPWFGQLEGYASPRVPKPISTKKPKPQPKPKPPNPQQGLF